MLYDIINYKSKIDIKKMILLKSNPIEVIFYSF